MPVDLTRMALLAVLVATGSCGGSGGGATSGGNTASSPTVGTTPSSPVYAEASDFTRDRSFTGIGSRILFDRSGPIPTTDIRLDPEATSFGFDYVAAGSTYRARYESDMLTAMTQPTTTVPTGDQFVGANSTFVRAPLFLGVNTANAPVGSVYMGRVAWSDNNGSGPADLGNRSTLRYILFGARTLASDLPTSGSSTLTGQAQISGGPSGGSGDSASIVINYATRTIAVATAFDPYSTGGTGSSTRPPPSPQPIMLSGTLDPTTGRVSGIATHVPTGATGAFEGALYGPRGVEAGILFSIKATDGTIYYGTIPGHA